MKLIYSFLLSLILSSFLFGQIKIEVSTDKQTYQYDDSIHVNVTATNIGAQDTTLNWGSSCQASYQIINKYDLMSNINCIAVLTSLSLEPMQSHSWSFKYNGPKLQDGYYRIVGEVLGYGISDTIEINFIDKSSRLYAAYYLGKVKDANGLPVLFATIVAQGADTTYTDPTGRFLLGFPSSSFSDSLTLHPLIKFSNPYFEDYSERITISKGDSITGPDVILQSRTSGMINVTGNVNFDNNTPVQSNCYITFYGLNNSTWYNTTPNSDGHYSIKVAKDSYFIRCLVEYYVGFFRTTRLKYYNGKPDLANADVLKLNNDTSGIDFIFPVLQTGIISGKVIDAVTQQPLSNTFIMVSTAEAGDSSGVGTDQNGNYSIPVFEGDYILFAYSMGYYPQYYKDADNIFDALPVTVGDDSLDLTGIDFELSKPEPGTNIISGSVRDELSYQPLSNVQVYAVPLAGGNWIEAKSDYNGMYGLRDIKNGEYILLFNKEGYISEYFEDAYQWEDANVFNLTGNQNIKVKDALLDRMNPFGGEISGKISSNGGSTLSGTLISALNSDGAVISTSFSVNGGGYTVPSLLNDNYTIKASKVGYKTSGYSGKINIDLSSQPVVNGVDISMDVTGIDGKGINLPKSFALFQNYPNPFNPTTTIRYSVPKASLIALKVYDILGREVETLVNEQKMASNYKVEFNGSKLASGIYFYRLSTGEYISTKKMILLK